MAGAHILHLLYEPRRSGISRHVLDQVRMLPELRHSVICPPLPGVADEVRALGGEAFEIPMGSKVLPSSVWLALPRRIRRLAPDILHLHALETGPFGTLAALLGKAPRVVFTPQTVEIRRQGLLPILREVLRLSATRHAAWIGVSEGQVAWLRELVAPERVHLVPNAAPPPRPLPDRDDARRRLGWPADRRVVACVGRLAAQKDPATFVRAAALLPDATHLLVGEGPLRDRLLPLAAPYPHVRLQGFVKDMDDVYAAADVICLASLWEGLPYGLLEAMAHGLPVIASRIDGNRDLVRHDETGLLFEPGDADGLREGLERLLSDHALRGRLGAAGQAHVRARFDSHVVAPLLRAVYARSRSAR